MFKLDRTAFKIQQHSEVAANNRSFWLSRTPQERLEAACFLINQAYRIDPNNPPKLDRNAFAMRKHTCV
jgi:hypothetical protein